VHFSGKVDAMPTGSVRQYAKDKRDGKYRDVYREIDKGTFHDPNAEVIAETKTIIKIRWK
jgi:heme/copper-type cytochrome/quinol oxidase subunit 2